jgi:ring-1,2-phenylacetyl-CoA epoxidase subunit PaaB
VSKIREQFAAPPPPEVPLADEPTGDLLPYVIFTQLKVNGPYIYAGWLEAADDAMAMAFAKEHYGQDQECVSVMAIRREHITSSDGLYGDGIEGARDRGTSVGNRERSRFGGGSTHPPTPSLGGRGSTAFRVFTQKKAGDLWLEAGKIEAVTPQAAIDAAKASLKMAQSAHAIWAVAEPNVISTHGDLVWRHTDQSYRLARGYGRVVRAKWTQFRDEKSLAEYEKEDLKEGF